MVPELTPTAPNTPPTDKRDARGYSDPHKSTQHQEPGVLAQRHSVHRLDQAKPRNRQPAGFEPLPGQLRAHRADRLRDMQNLHALPSRSTRVRESAYPMGIRLSRPTPWRPLFSQGRPYGAPRPHGAPWKYFFLIPKISGAHRPASLGGLLWLRGGADLPNENPTKTELRA